MTTALRAVLLCLIVMPLIAECAKSCYSGSKDQYKPRICGQGGTDNQFMCQKFECVGGKSPFVLRTCANKNMGCLAGPAICRFSGGTGSCSRCDKDNCNR